MDKEFIEKHSLNHLVNGEGQKHKLKIIQIRKSAGLETILDMGKAAEYISKDGLALCAWIGESGHYIALTVEKYEDRTVVNPFKSSKIKHLKKHIDDFINQNP